MIRLDYPESLYGWTRTDYWCDIYDCRYPEDPTEVDKASEENWLEYLERLAIK